MKQIRAYILGILTPQSCRSLARRVGSGHTIIVVRYEGLNDRRWNCVSQTTKSFIQLTGVDFSATIPIVSVKNDLHGAMKNKNKPHTDGRWMYK
jgi:hypothetical protein